MRLLLILTVFVLPSCVSPLSMIPRNWYPSSMESKPKPKPSVPLYAPFETPIRLTPTVKDPHVTLGSEGFSVTVPTDVWDYERDAVIAGFGGQGVTADLLLTHRKLAAVILVGSMPWAAGTPALIALHNRDAIVAAAGSVDSVQIDPTSGSVSFLYKTNTQRGKVVVMRGKEYPEVTVVVFGGWPHKAHDDMVAQLDALVASVTTFKPK